jgi:hypothetical protein
VEWFLTNCANDLFGSCLENGRLFSANFFTSLALPLVQTGSWDLSISLRGKTTKNESSIFAMFVSM